MVTLHEGKQFIITQEIRGCEKGPKAKQARRACLFISQRAVQDDHRVVVARHPDRCRHYDRAYRHR